MTYAQLNSDGTYWRDLPEGNVEFSPTVFQPARTLTPEQMTEFRVVPLVETTPTVTEHQSAARDGAEKVNGEWRMKWVVLDWTADEIAAYEKAKVPQSVTNRQGMEELIFRGLDGQVQSALDAMTGIAGKKARNDFLRSQVWQRDWPLIAQMALAFGWTEAYVDEMFISAGKR